MTTVRAQHIEEAQRLRNLGFYHKAHEEYERAEQESPEDGGLLLTMEIAAMLIEQGLVRSSAEKSRLGIELYADTTASVEVVALAQLFQACATSACSDLYTPYFDMFRSTYSKHLQGRIAEDFDDKTLVRYNQA
jgi:hypothetical protein